jgi:hypothetical protein
MTTTDPSAPDGVRIFTDYATRRMREIEEEEIAEIERYKTDVWDD